jgi:phage tail-like protein
MALLSQTALRADPVLNHNFVVSLLDSSSSLAKAIAISALLDVAVGGFSECSGIEMSMKPEEHNEGGNNGATLRFPSRVTWSNLTLRKGLSVSDALWKWHYGFVEGRGTRRDGAIILLSELRLPSAIWLFRRGLPVKYTGPQLNAAQNAVALEAIEIAHEGITQLPFVGLGSAVASAGAGAIAGALR